MRKNLSQFITPKNFLGAAILAGVVIGSIKYLQIVNDNNQNESKNPSQNTEELFFQIIDGLIEAVKKDDENLINKLTKKTKEIIVNQLKNNKELKEFRQRRNYTDFVKQLPGILITAARKNIRTIYFYFDKTNQLVITRRPPTSDHTLGSPITNDMPDFTLNPNTIPQQQQQQQQQLSLQALHYSSSDHDLARTPNQNHHEHNTLLGNKFAALLTTPEKTGGSPTGSELQSRNDSEISRKLALYIGKIQLGAVSVCENDFQRTIKSETPNKTVVLELAGIFKQQFIDAITEFMNKKNEAFDATNITPEQLTEFFTDIIIQLKNEYNPALINSNSPYTEEDYSLLSYQNPESIQKSYFIQQLSFKITLYADAFLSPSHVDTYTNSINDACINIARENEEKAECQSSHTPCFFLSTPAFTSQSYATSNSTQAVATASTLKTTQF